MANYRKSQIVGVSSAISLMVAWISLESFGIFNALYGYEWYSMDFAQWIGMVIFSIGTGIILVNLLAGFISVEDAYQAQSELFGTMSGKSQDEIDTMLKDKAKNIVRYIQDQDQEKEQENGEKIIPPAQLLDNIRSQYLQVATSSVFCVSEKKAFLSTQKIEILPTQDAELQNVQTLTEFRQNAWKQGLLIVALGAVVFLITKLLQYYG